VKGHHEDKYNLDRLQEDQVATYLDQWRVNRAKLNPEITYILLDQQIDVVVISGRDVCCLFKTRGQRPELIILRSTKRFLHCILGLTSSASAYLRLEPKELETLPLTLKCWASGASVH
jgi:hypothetical protein